MSNSSNKNVQSKRGEEGVTLVALIITLITSVVLAGATISSMSDSKIIEYAKEGAQKYSEEAEKENKILRSAEKIIENALTKLNEIKAQEDILNI